MIVFTFLFGINYHKMAMDNLSEQLYTLSPYDALQEYQHMSSIDHVSKSHPIIKIKITNMIIKDDIKLDLYSLPNVEIVWGYTVEEIQKLLINKKFIFTNGEQHFDEHGLLHRIDGPAYKKTNEFCDIEQWYIHGALDRHDWCPIPVVSIKKTKNIVGTDIVTKYVTKNGSQNFYSETFEFQTDKN